MVEITEAETKKAAKKLTPLVLVELTAGVSVVVSLAAVFLLSGWAEASTLAHGAQHVLLFLGGVGFGSSMLGIYQKKGNKDEG